MNENQIKQIVEKTLVLPDMDKLSTWKSSSCLWDQIKAGANLIPVFGGAIAQEIQNIQNYKDREFLRKYVAIAQVDNVERISLLCLVNVVGQEAILIKNVHSNKVLQLF